MRGRGGRVYALRWQGISHRSVIYKETRLTLQCEQCADPCRIICRIITLGLLTYAPTSEIDRDGQEAQRVERLLDKFKGNNTMLRFDSFSATQDNARNATADRDRHLVQLLTTMTDRIVKLEEQLDYTIVKLEARLDGLDSTNPRTFDERVLEVLDVRSGTAFSHIEAEIDEKLSDFIDSYSFTEAVAEAVEGSVGEQVKQKLDDILHDAIIDAIGDAEDIVRKGLRSIL